MTVTDTWRAQAACEQWPARLFMPEAKGGPGQVPSSVTEANYVLDHVCSGCPVRDLCLLVKPENGVGIWGGYLFGDLSRIKDSYEPVKIKARSVNGSRPGNTPSATAATRASTPSRLTTTQNNPRNAATRPRGHGSRGDQLRCLVRDHPGISTGELVKITGLSWPSVKDHLRRLHESGRLRKVQLPRSHHGPQTSWFAA